MSSCPARYRLVVPVWGAHRELFLRCTLPSLLLPGNLPTLCRSGRVRIELLTRPLELADLRRAIERSELPFGCDLHVDSLALDPLDRYGAMSACHRAALRDARANDRFLLVNADLVLCDGALRFVVERADAGVRVILAPGVRLEAEAAQVALWPLLRPGRTGLDPRTLVDLAMRTLHPLIERHLFEEGDGAWQIPAMCAWRVGDEGLLLRCFHLHPLLVVPGADPPELRGTIDDAYVWQLGLRPEQIHVARDSDELALFELSSLDHPGGDCVPRGSSFAFANWIRRATGPAHRALARIPIELRRVERSAAWDRVAARSAAQLTRRIRLGAALPLAVPWRVGTAAGRLERALRGRRGGLRRAATAP